MVYHSLYHVGRCVGCDARIASHAPHRTGLAWIGLDWIDLDRIGSFSPAFAFAFSLSFQFLLSISGFFFTISKAFMALRCFALLCFACFFSLELRLRFVTTELVTHSSEILFCEAFGLGIGAIGGGRIRREKGEGIGVRWQGRGKRRARGREGEGRRDERREKHSTAFDKGGRIHACIETR